MTRFWHCVNDICIEELIIFVGRPINGDRARDREQNGEQTSDSPLHCFTISSANTKDNTRLTT